MPINVRRRRFRSSNESLPYTKVAAHRAVRTTIGQELQAHEALEIYFDFLKKSVSSFPSGGAELGEKLKDQSVQNIIAVRELVKKLSQAKDFEEAFRIQTEFMQSQLQAFGEQIKSLGEAARQGRITTMAKDQKPADQMDAFSKQAMAYTKEAAGGVKMPFKSSLD